MEAVKERFNQRLTAYTVIFQDGKLAEQVQRLYQSIHTVLSRNGKLLLCGNGGSAADCQHIVGEFVGRLRRDRAAWPALSLCMDPAVMTCLSNDYAFDQVFKRPIEAFGAPGDLLIALSTSGNSLNIQNAIETARDNAISTLLVTNYQGGVAAALSDKTIFIPSENPQIVQEVTVAIFHTLCELLEDAAE